MADPRQIEYYASEEYFLKNHPASSQCQTLAKRLVEMGREDSNQEDDKASFGCLQSPLIVHTMDHFDKENSPLMSYGSKDNQKLAKQVNSDTCNVLLDSPRRNLLPEFEKCLDPSMPNSPDQKQPLPIVLKKKVEMENLLSSESSLSEGTTNETGSQYGPPQSPDFLSQFQPISEWYLIGPSGRLPATSQLACQLKDMLQCYGELLALENQSVLGMKLESMLMLKIHDPSFGMVTKVRRVLLLMNFEEESTSRICCDGLIVTRSVWRSKAVRDRRLWKRCGSHPMSTQTVGTQT